MYAFEWHEATSVADASAALARSGGRALAGGQSLIAAMRMRLAQPGTLVDLRGIAELRGITASPEGLTIGAMTRHAEVAASADVRRTIPALAALAEAIGDAQVRNMGTIGGSIATNDPAADWPAGVVGLAASVTTSKRTIPGDAFFTGLYETALGGDEIITAVDFRTPKRAAYVKFPNPASRFALVGVFVAQLGDGSVRVAVSGAGPCVFRSGPLEAALSRRFTVDAAREVKIAAEGLNGDLHGSPDYRAHLIPVLAGRAVAAAG